jgi:hypothetical protein
MKKIYIIQILLLSIFLAGCSSTEYHEFENSQVKIESADVNFSALGGTGEIVVAESGNITAEIDQNWCSLSVSGKTISVTVTPNMSISGRSAQVTVKSGNKINYVSVTQTSVTLNMDATSASIDGKGGEVRIACQTEANLIIDNVADSWLTASTDGNDIVLQVATGNPSMDNVRTTTVTVAVQDQNGTTLFTQDVNVTQGKNYLVYEDYLGTYTMNYSITNASNVSTRSLTVTLSIKDEGQTYRLDGILADGSPGELLVRYNSNGMVSILGQIMYVYPDTQYDFWFLPYSQTAPNGSNYTSRSTTIGMISTDIDLSNGGLKFKMVDNGVWGSYVVAGFLLRNYDGSTSKGNVNGKDGQAFYFYPVFEKQ